MDIPLEKLGKGPKCYACENKLTGTKKECYACEHDLTGLVKERWGDEFDQFEDHEEIWECLCTEWECRCNESKKSEWLFYCPLCEDWFNQSRHLREALTHQRVRWLANMVTHYRHNHRKWDKQYRYIDVNPYMTEETYKRAKCTVNEQAKRQILRKASAFLFAHGFAAGDFEALENTEAKTLELAKKKLALG